MKIENPFLTKSYISPEYFCNREKETQLLADAVINGRDITIFSLRRLGKTGLIDNTAYHLKKKKGYAYIYSDIYKTESIEELVNTLTIQIMMQLFSKKSIWQKMGSFFKHIAPTISYDNISGAPEISFKFNQTSEAFNTLDELFALVNQHSKPVYWAWDEFQQINFYENPSSVLRHLRTLVQKSNNIRFVFSGSHSNMLISIFNDAKQPFYKSTQLIELKEIDAPSYTKFIENHFKKAKKHIESKAIDYILEITLLHTWYTQTLCNRLFQKYLNVSITEVKLELTNILEEMEVSFFRYRQILPRGQWELLKAFGNEEKVFKPTSQEFIQKNKLKGSASVLLALKKLINDEFIVEQYEGDQKYYRLNDVFFIRWVQWKFKNA